MAIFVAKGHSQDPQTMGGAFIRRVRLLRRIRYSKASLTSFKYSKIYINRYAIIIKVRTGFLQKIANPLHLKAWTGHFSHELLALPIGLTTFGLW